MTSLLSDDTPASWYAGLRSRLGREPDAAACLEWARTHPDDPEAYLALAQAGHLWAAKHEHERALDLYEQAQTLHPDGAGWLAACIAGQLFDLDRDVQARAAIDALHRRLQAAPETDAFAYAEMADLFQDMDDPAAALQWCEEGLERYYPDAGVEDESPDELAIRLWTTRMDLRGQLALEPDALDRAVEAQLERITDDLRELATVLQDVHDEREGVPGQLPGTGLVMFWPEEAFTTVQQRWPALLSEADDYPAYCRGVEASAHTLAEMGAARVVLAATPMPDYEAYATAEERDPSDPATRTAFAAERVEHYSAATIPWPPPRNGPCWCGSGRKYKKCCGDPRHQ